MDSAIKFEKTIFEKTNEWLNYIDNLPKPQDDIDRAHNHYKAEQFIVKYTKKHENLCNDLVSILFFPFSILATSISTLVSKFFCHSTKYDCIKICVTKPGSNSQKGIALPGDLKSKYKKIKNCFVHRRTLICTGIISKYSLRLWLNALARHPFSFYENFNIFIHLNFINKILIRYNPKAIVTLETENDFTTSLLSNLCEHNGVFYIGIMHGENFVNPLHTNVRFSCFYVWDKHYIKQYMRTGTPAKIFRIYCPKRFKMNINNKGSKEKAYLTYYLQGQNEMVLNNIKNVLDLISKSGKKCRIRLHPRATDKKLIERIFFDTAVEIEDYNVISIEESYASTNYIVSTFSTVLTEAYENRLNAVIDDVTDRSTYNILEKLMYINIERIHLRLSEIIKNLGGINNE